MRHSQPDDTTSTEGDDASFREEGIVRRFPRVGAQFQTRISKSTGFTVRPSPERMSVDFPYISEKEAVKFDYPESNHFLEAKAKPVATKSDFDANLSDKKSNRGGTLLHKPGKQVGEFSKYVKPFIMSTDKQVNPAISNEAWIQHMIQLHSTEATGTRSRSSRGGVKRKRVENEEMIWNLENILNNLQKSRQKNVSTDILGEEEATALEHLCRSFDGNIDAARLNLLVELSGGQASKMRKREERERKKRKLKTPSHQTSESWREMFESFTQPYTRTLLGQLQEDTDVFYAMQASTSVTQRVKSHEDTNVNLMLEPDDLKGAWRSILACAKSIERQLNNESLGPDDKKPLLSTLLIFVGKAYELPTPEKCFGTHHVMIEEVSNTIISILNHVKTAQNVHAKIRDKLFNDAEEGINSDNLLKFLETEYRCLPIRLEEVEKLYEFQDVVVEWESRLIQVLSVAEEDLEDVRMVNYLGVAENMQYEARSHGYRSKALVQLTGRINKAYDLRDKILKWKCSGVNRKMTTIRTVAGFVKEAKRIKLFSPEVQEIVDYYRLAEEWIDRANIAIRSKVSLDELKNLIQRGEEMSLDLSEFVDKLKTRVRIADDWLEALDEIIPFKDDGCTSLEIWQNLETSLKNGIHNGLYELSSEGNRIPVDVVAVKLLQLALDAKNWTTKALKWIPDTAESKKGKLCDLREHLEKVSSLRDKLPLPEIEREKWKPAGESELTAIILAADSWAEKNKVFLAGDNRKGDERSCLSIRQLRAIVDEGNAIYANVGNSIAKISRVLVQAENWYGSHSSLLEHCGILSRDHAVENAPKALFTTIPEMSAAVEAARMNVSLDLEEAMELRKILAKTSSWNERVTLIAPRRNKRHSKGSRPKFSLKDLIGLIEEASNLPIDTNESVNRLQDQLNEVEIWRSEASKALHEILVEFSGLKSHIEDVYGEAEDYSMEQISQDYVSDDDNVEDEIEVSEKNENKDAGESDNTSDNNSENMLESRSGGREDVPMSNRGSNSVAIFRLIRELKEETKDISVNTAEGEIADLLDSASNWCIKSFKYLSTPREVFDKRFFGAFNRFVAEGEELYALSRNSQAYSTFVDGLSEKLFYAWGVIVEEQLVRLNILKKEREKFEAWCSRASQILSDQKNLTAERLVDLAKTSRNFPANRDLVSKIRGLSVKVSKWTEEVRKLFESGEKLDLQDARFLVETGEKLKVQTEELKTLKAEIRAARNWSSKASDCNGSIDVATVKELIEDHNNLLIEMPDELEALQEATVGYCICRRPYEGFMIGCDHCEEWYHGSCIGISESKADKVEKFTCVRCSTKNIFKNSATTAVGIIRKWTCSKDFKKARQIEFQKFQRKDRKEKKDIEKFLNQIKNLEDCLSELKRKDKPSEEKDNSMETDAIETGDVGRISIAQQSENQSAQSDGAHPSKASTATNTPMESKSNGNTVTIDATVTVNVTENAKDSTSNAQETADKKETEDGVGLSSSIDSCQSMTLSEDEILSQIEKAKISLQLSKDRLKKVTEQSRQKALDEAREDKYSTILRYWCLKVRSDVLAPPKEEQSEKSRPLASGSMSLAMMELISEAEKLGIRHLSDIEKMVCSFETMCWSFSAMHVLRRKPDVSEVRRLVLEVPTAKLAAEKALRTLKFMTNRASQLQSKFQKALNSKRAVSKPTNISFLKDFQSGFRDCPLSIPEEDILRVVIEDGKIPDREHLANRVEKLRCRRCNSTNSNEAVSPHAPNPTLQWPPFGSDQSQSATEAFGSECLAIPLDKIPNLVATEGYEESGNPLQETSARIVAFSEPADPVSSSLSLPKTLSMETAKSCNEKPNQVLRSEKFPSDAESRGERGPTADNCHESYKTAGGPPITTVSSNSSYPVPCVDALSPALAASSTIGHDQPDSRLDKEMAVDQLVGSDLLNNVRDSQIESKPTNVNENSTTSAPTVISNNAVQLSPSGNHTHDKTGAVDSPNTNERSTDAIDDEPESNPKVEPSLPASSVDTSQNGEINKKLESRQINGARTLDGSTSGCGPSSMRDSKLDTGPKAEKQRADPLFPDPSPKNGITNESNCHQKREIAEMPLSPRETHDTNQNTNVENHPSSQIQTVDVSISNGSTHHNHLDTTLRTDTRTIVPAAGPYDINNTNRNGSENQTHDVPLCNEPKIKTVSKRPLKKRMKMSCHSEDK